MRSTLFIASAAAHQRLTTPAFVKQMIETCASDIVLNAWIETASALVASLLNFPHTAQDPAPLARQSYRETFRLDAPAASLALSRKPAANVIAVTVGGVEYFQTDAVFEVSEQEGLVSWLSAGRYSAFGVGTVLVDYDAGFVMDDQTLEGGGIVSRTVPRALELACVMLIEKVVARGSPEILAPIKSESIPGLGAVDYAVAAPAEEGAIPSAVQRLIAPYAIAYPA